MTLHTGDMIKATFRDGRGRNLEKDKRGEVISISRNFIVVKFENYTESFNIADIIDPNQSVLKVRKNNEWLGLNIKMLQERRQ